MTDESDRGVVQRVLDSGVGLTGAVSGAAVELWLGSPTGVLAGAVAGQAVGEACRWALADVVHRRLSRREEVRVGGVAGFAAIRLNYLLVHGARLRTDGYFATQPDGRTPGAEIAEGVLLAARDAFEERKVRHIGYLLANVAVNPEIDAGLAAAQLRRAEGLTWRQLVLIEAVARQREGGTPLPSGNFTDGNGVWTSWGARAELADLHRSEIVWATHPAIDGKRIGGISTEMTELFLPNAGALLRDLLSLDLIEQGDVDEVVEALVAGG